MILKGFGVYGFLLLLLLLWFHFVLDLDSSAGALFSHSCKVILI